MISVSGLLMPAIEQALRQEPLALLCLATDWTVLAPQTLALALALRQSGRAITLVVTAASPLHTQALAHGLPCQALTLRWKSVNAVAAFRLAQWLRRQHIEVLLTTDNADLGLAGLTRRWRGSRLRLVHRQLLPLPENLTWGVWWTIRQVRFVAAWLAPLPHHARAVLDRTPLDARRLWVVPPVLTTEPTAGSQTDVRQLLDLPPDVPLIGLLDCGENGSGFATEALFRLRHELGSRAGLVVLGSPATPPQPTRWNELRQLARQLHLAHCLHLRPLHNAASPALAYKALDVILLPVPANASGLPLLRAMAAGCPLVSVATPDALDLLRHGSPHHLFAPHDLAACAQALSLALRASEGARHLARQAAATVARQCSAGQQSNQLDTILQYVCHHAVVA